MLVTQNGNDLGAFTADLQKLVDISKDQISGNSPFDSWTGLDAVFQVSSPARVVFSRGAQIVTLLWSSKSWTAGTLTLPNGVQGLSTAVSGMDGKLYYFFGSSYGEADPSTL